MKRFWSALRSEAERMQQDILQEEGHTVWRRVAEGLSRGHAMNIMPVGIDAEFVETLCTTAQSKGTPNLMEMEVHALDDDGKAVIYCDACRAFYSKWRFSFKHIELREEEVVFTSLGLSRDDARVRLIRA